MCQVPPGLQEAGGLWNWTRTVQKNSGPNRMSTRVDYKQECWGDCTSQMDETTAKNRNLTVFPNMLLSKNLQFPRQFHLFVTLPSPLLQVICRWLKSPPGSTEELSSYAITSLPYFESVHFGLYCPCIPKAFIHRIFLMVF